jgi:hypothetical protein
MRTVNCVPCFCACSAVIEFTLTVSSSFCCFVVVGCPNLELLKTELITRTRSNACIWSNNDVSTQIDIDNLSTSSIFISVPIVKSVEPIAAKQKQVGCSLTFEAPSHSLIRQSLLRDKGSLEYKNSKCPCCCCACCQTLSLGLQVNNHYQLQQLKLIWSHASKLRDPAASAAPK